MTVPPITLNDHDHHPPARLRRLPGAAAGDRGDRDASAFDVGYRHIDTAQMYRNEAGVGEAIASSGIPRDELYITTKLNNTNHRPDDVRRSFDESRKALGLEQVDLFLIHWPLPTRYDGDFVSTWKAMTALVADGGVKSVGVSNFQADHLDRIIDETGVIPAVNQIEAHPYLTNDATREASAAPRHQGRGLVADRPGPGARRPGDHRDRRVPRQDRRRR